MTDMPVNPDRPFGMPTEPVDIIATAHRAAPFVWRKRVGFIRRAAAAHAVRGALQMQRIRLTRLLQARRLQPPYSDDEHLLLRDAASSYRNMVWVHFMFNPADDACRRRAKDLTVGALSITDRMVKMQSDVEEANHANR